MDLTYLKKIVKIVEQSIVDEIEIEEEGLKVRIAKNQNKQAGLASISPQIPVPLVTAPAQVQPLVEHAATAEIESEIKYHEVKSPIVGTFYRAPAPDADSYVEVGQVIQVKQVLCIIEAMKLMNEIESEVSGRVVKILVENAQPVEYNQTLFLIEPV